MEQILELDIYPHPSVIKTSENIIASTSNWGAYGLIAGISLVEKSNFLPSVKKGKELIEKSTSIKKNLVYKKDNLKIKDKAAKKLRWVLHLKEIKNVKQEDAFPANEPRYSYWPK